ncbi:MAG: A/G-specific adenine glycosylase [Gemmatimonadota bacterium]|nr:A/G-specific adenine glycosylase [Gemmatimonadota bacterium]
MTDASDPSPPPGAAGRTADDAGTRAAVACLLAWFRSRERDVPWDGDPDPYRVWVAEVMAQQTRLAVVRERLAAFLDRFPDLDALAAADTDDVLKAWEGLGYYARARNLQRAARAVAGRHGGRLPSDPQRLRELPGIGPYTAGAIASLAFGRREPAVDGNVRRVLARLHDLERPSPAELDAAARDLLAAAPGPPGEVNQALMDLGGAVCTPRRPRCGRCPLADACIARARGTQEKRPARRRRAVLPHHDIAVAVTRRDGRILIGRRPEDGLLGGLWEFPGGKVAGGETPAAAAGRELREEMCVEAEIGAPIAVVEHAYSHFRITLHAFEARWTAGEPCGRAVSDWRWVRPSELGGYAFPAANRRVLERIAGAG